MVLSSSNGLLPSCKTLQNLTYLFHEKSEIVILRPILFPFAQILGKNVILIKSNIKTVSGSPPPSKKSQKSNEHILKKKKIEGSYWRWLWWSIMPQLQWKEKFSWKIWLNRYFQFINLIFYCLVSTARS